MIYIRILLSPQGDRYVMRTTALPAVPLSVPVDGNKAHKELFVPVPERPARFRSSKFVFWIAPRYWTLSWLSNGLSIESW